MLTKYDVFTRAASRYFKVPIQQVTKKQKQAIKEMYYRHIEADNDRSIK